jgi:hypothetical protein
VQAVATFGAKDEAFLLVDLEILVAKKIVIMVSLPPLPFA